MDRAADEQTIVTLAQSRRGRDGVGDSIGECDPKERFTAR